MPARGAEDYIPSLAQLVGDGTLQRRHLVSDWQVLTAAVRKREEFDGVPRPVHLRSRFSMSREYQDQRLTLTDRPFGFLCAPRPARLANTLRQRLERSGSIGQRLSYLGVVLIPTAKYGLCHAASITMPR